MSTTDTPDTTIADALAALGTTSRGVARCLREAGIRGRQCDAGSCPVSRYVRAVCEIPRDRVVVATRSFVGANGYTHAVPPPPVVAFMRDFDDGLYSDLHDEMSVGAA